MARRVVWLDAQSVIDLAKNPNAPGVLADELIPPDAEVINVVGFGERRNKSIALLVDSDAWPVVAGGIPDLHVRVIDTERLEVATWQAR